MIYFILSIILFIILVIGVIFYRDKIEFYWKQLKHMYLFQKSPFRENLHNNQMTLINRIPLKICFLTMESRNQEEFVKLHNQSIENYVKIQNQRNSDIPRQYSYVFVDKCELSGHIHNVYWCKLFLTQNLLESNQYDYVIWLDSDTIIFDNNVDVGDIVSSYQSDFLAATDGSKNINAGVLIFKNSEKAKEMLDKMLVVYNTKSFQNECMNPDNSLKGLWANTCYEQMNVNMICLDYREYITLLPPNVISHRYARNGFIIHMCGRTASDRAKKFKMLMNL